MVAEVAGEYIPFEVKYRTQRTSLQDLRGFLEFCDQKNVKRGYIVTKSIDDFGLLEKSSNKTQILRIPATLLCYWMGEMEINHQKQVD